MNSETKKIGLACFIGGFLGSLVALLVAPTFWWLGLVAGFATGYVSHEFRSVLRAIPTAWEVAREVGGERLRDFKGWFKEVKEWFQQPHAFLYPFLLLSITVWTSTVGLLVWNNPPTTGQVIGSFVVTFFFVAIVSALVFAFFVALGQTIEMGEGINELEWIAYADVLRWAAKGVGWMILFFIWIVPIWCPWKGVCFLFRFIPHLFRLIHSDKRLLCGVDSAIGVAASFSLSLWYSVPGYGGVMFFAVCGGIIGAAFGILNWELVSKRWLKVPASIPVMK